MKCCNSLFVHIVGDIYMWCCSFYICWRRLIFDWCLDRVWSSCFNDLVIKEWKRCIGKYQNMTEGMKFEESFQNCRDWKVVIFFNGWRILKFAWQVMINIKRERVRALWEIDVCQKLNVAKHFLLTKRFHSYHE